MSTVNTVSLRDEFDAYKADIASLRKEGKITKKADEVIGGLCRLLEIMNAIFLEKETKKTSKNSSIPPSQTGKDETKKSPRKPRDTSAARNSMTGENFETVTVEEISTVEACDSCGTDLSDIEPSAREQRVLLDIKFTVKEVKVVADIKDCPGCDARTRGRFPENMPGPLQYGDGIKALTIDLLVVQMLSLNRCTELVQAMTGIKMSQATCLGYIDRLYDSLEPWEASAKDLLTRPALHADETGIRVNRKNWWLHVTRDGILTLKILHSKRDKESIDSFGFIPFYTGTLIHDRWAAYFADKLCKHQVCESHLLRDITFVVDSNNYRWVRLMKKLLCECCDAVNKSETGVLSEAECRKYVKRYRTILTQGGKEMPEIPKRRDGKRGRIAKSDAHNLHEALSILEECVLRFMSDPDVSFTNNTGEQKIRMSKVKIKVSGCFRTEHYAHAWCRITSYLDSMGALGYNPLVAIQIALAGNAADMIEHHDRAA